MSLKLSYHSVQEENNMSVQKVSPAMRSLLRASYINLTTFRKSGVAVLTPVWFAEHAGTIYVETGENFGKIKRVRHTPRVTMAPCTVSGKVTGSEVAGKARVVTATDEVYVAKGAMHKKYGFLRTFSYFIMESLSLLSRKPSSDFAYLAIEPVEQA
jgi:uncharacterized protein